MLYSEIINSRERVRALSGRRKPPEIPYFQPLANTVPCSKRRLKPLGAFCVGTALLLLVCLLPRLVHNKLTGWFKAGQTTRKQSYHHSSSGANDQKARGIGSLEGRLPVPGEKPRIPGSK
ncbi:hypothetical protein CEXT_511561 [Caerostris extrusa]|uniref:Uncharacterized protein n=1 Tax=Caerostris extrusa TaxID=172846 RepID=A0AAV4PLI3_CAEEX|nr:hypothetical protein CEXT_511561 [Caerostris extrusa]